MDDSAVREQAQAFCEAIVGGDVDKAIGFMSAELHRNLGEVIALLPLPATEAAIDSLAAGGSGYNVVLRLVGETETVLIQSPPEGPRRHADSIIDGQSPEQDPNRRDRRRGRGGWPGRAPRPWRRVELIASDRLPSATASWPSSRPGRCR